MTSILRRILKTPSNVTNQIKNGNSGSLQDWDVITICGSVQYTMKEKKKKASEQRALDSNFELWQPIYDVQEKVHRTELFVSLVQ